MSTGLKSSYLRGEGMFLEVLRRVLEEVEAERNLTNSIF